MAIGRPLADDTVRAGDAALEEWASVMGRDSQALGWPQRTLLGRVIEQGFTGAAQLGAGAPTEIPEHIARIDASVLKLPPKYLRVVRVWYVSKARHNQSACARIARMSHRQFRDCLRVAREFVGHALRDG